MKKNACDKILSSTHRYKHYAWKFLISIKSYLIKYFFSILFNIFLLFYYLKDSCTFNFFKSFYLFLQRGEGRKKEGERNINVWLPLARPLLGTWPTTQASARTHDPLVHSLALNTRANFFFNYFIVVQLQLSAFTPHNSPPTSAKIFFIDLRKRGREGGRERERKKGRETSICCST